MVIIYQRHRYSLSIYKKEIQQENQILAPSSTIQGKLIVLMLLRHECCRMMNSNHTNMFVNVFAQDNDEAY